MIPNDYVEALAKAFAAKGDEDVAAAQSKYMRDLFPYYGLKRPERNVIQSAFILENGLPNNDELIEIAQLCFRYDEREMQYFALDLMMRLVKKQDAEFWKVIEELVQTKSWWDSVDYLSSISGKYFLKHDDLVPTIPNRWIANKDFWLNRVAIIFQLHHKDETDEALLYEYILRHAGSQEFFIQKACGWALRQHSKREPKSVQSFIESNELSRLTVREGLKYINKK